MEHLRPVNCEQRVEIRRELAEHEEYLEDANHIGTYNDILHANQIQEKIFDKVQRLDMFELTQDAVNFKKLTQAAEAVTRHTQVVSFGVDDFISRLAAHYTERDHINWERMGREFLVTSKSTTSCTFFDAVLPSEAPAKRARVPVVRQKQSLGERVVPVDVPEQPTNSSTDRRAEAMFAALAKYKKEGRPAFDYFAFVVDPDSFGHTIENIFALSVLINMGHVELKMVEGREYIHLNEKQLGKDAAASEHRVPFKQHILRYDLEKHERIIRAYKLKKPMFVFDS